MVAPPPTELSKTKTKHQNQIPCPSVLDGPASVSLSVVIPAYNEEARLPATLDEVLSYLQKRQQRAPSSAATAPGGPFTWEVIDVAREHGADRVVFEPHNQIARARNAGAAATGAEWLVFLDADTRLTASLLRQGLAALASGTVAAGGARVAMDREVTLMVAWIVGLWDRVATTLTYAAGSFFFTRRDAFEAAGGFDEAVYAGEEVWLARRIKAWAKKRGLAFRVLPEPVVTSARKSDWFSTKDFLAQLAVIFLIPGATRSRRLCAIWYRRPETGGPETLTKSSAVSE